MKTSTLVILILILAFVVYCAVSCAEEEKKNEYSHRTKYVYFGAPTNFLLHKNSITPALPIEPKDNYQEVKILEDNWETIRDEAISIFKNNIESDSHGAGLFKNFTKSWTRFYLKWYGRSEMKNAREYAPKTMKLLDQIPEIHLALFSIMPPGTYLHAHRGPYAGSLRYHLGLQCPKEKCHIIVAGIPYKWRDGEGILFDDTYTHEVYNNSDETRIILFCDIQRKMDSSWKDSLLTWANKSLLPIADKVNSSIEQRSEKKQETRFHFDGLV